MISTDNKIDTYSQGYTFLLYRWSGSIVAVILLSLIAPAFIVNNPVIDYLASLVPSINIWSRNISHPEEMRFVWVYMVYSLPFALVYAFNKISFFSRKPKAIEADGLKFFFSILLFLLTFVIFLEIFFWGSFFGKEFFSEAVDFAGTSGSAMGGLYVGRGFFSVLLAVGVAIYTFVIADLMLRLLKKIAFDLKGFINKLL